MSDRSPSQRPYSPSSRSRSPEEQNAVNYYDNNADDAQERLSLIHQDNNNNQDLPLATNSRRSTNNNSPAQQGYVNPHQFLANGGGNHQQHSRDFVNNAQDDQQAQIQQQEHLMKILTDPERTTLIDDESMLMSDVNQLHENLQSASYEKMGWENLNQRHQQKQNNSNNIDHYNQNNVSRLPSVKTPFELSFQHQQEQNEDEENAMKRNLFHQQTQFLHDDETFHPDTPSISENNNINQQQQPRSYNLPSEENIHDQQQSESFSPQQQRYQSQENNTSENGHHLISSMAKFMLGREEVDINHNNNDNDNQQNVSPNRNEYYYDDDHNHHVNTENNNNYQMTPDSSPIISANQQFNDENNHDNNNYEHPMLKQTPQNADFRQVVNAILETEPGIKEYLSTAEKNANVQQEQHEQQQAQIPQESIKNFEHFMDTQFDSSKFSQQDATFFMALQKRLKELKTGLWGGNELLEYVGLRRGGGADDDDDDEELIGRQQRRAKSSSHSPPATTTYENLVEFSASMQRETSRRRAEQPFSFSVAANPRGGTQQKSRAQLEKEAYEKNKKQQMEDDFYNQQYPNHHRGTYFSAVSDIQQSLQQSREKLHNSFESVFRQQQDREFRLEKLKNDLSQYFTSKYGSSSSLVESKNLLEPLEKSSRENKNSFLKPTTKHRSELTLHDILNETSGNQNKFYNSIVPKDNNNNNEIGSHPDERIRNKNGKKIFVAAPFVEMAASIAHEKRTLYRRFLTPSFQEAVMQDWDKKRTRNIAMK